MTRIRSILGAAALLAGVAAPGALAPVLVAAPAQAAACTTQGVTVVVDFGDLGGGVKQACVTDGGGRTAATLFPAAGFALTYAQRAAGAVCRVEGVPTSDPCQSMPQANAYWSLWWSDGHSASWTYASLGVQSLSIPAGGDVAFSWQGSNAKNPPNVPATVIQASTPAPAQTAAAQKSPQAQKSSKPKASTIKTPTPKTAATTSAATPSASASRSVSPGVSASAVASATGSTSASAVPSSSAGSSAAADSSSPTASADASAVAATSSSSSPGDADGLPGWVAPVVVVAVLAAGGGVAVARRRTRA